MFYITAPCGAIVFMTCALIAGATPKNDTSEGINYEAVFSEFTSKVKELRNKCQKKPQLWKRLYVEVTTRLLLETGCPPFKNFGEVKHRFFDRIDELDFSKYPLQKWKYLAELRAWREFLDDYGEYWIRFAYNQPIFATTTSFFKYDKWKIFEGFGGESCLKLSNITNRIILNNISNRERSEDPNYHSNQAKNILKHVLLKQVSLFENQDILYGKRGLLRVSEHQFYSRGYIRESWVLLRELRSWARFLIRYDDVWYRKWASLGYAQPPIVKYDLQYRTEQNQYRDLVNQTRLKVLNARLAEDKRKRKNNMDARRQASLRNANQRPRFSKTSLRPNLPVIPEL